MRRDARSARRRWRRSCGSRCRSGGPIEGFGVRVVELGAVRGGARVVAEPGGHSGLDHDDRRGGLAGVDRLVPGQQCGVRGCRSVLERVRVLSECPVVAGVERRFELLDHLFVAGVGGQAGQPGDLACVRGVVLGEHRGEFRTDVRQPGSERRAIQRLGGQFELHRLTQELRVALGRARRCGGRGAGDAERGGAGDADRAQCAEEAAPGRCRRSGVESHGGGSFRGHAYDSLPAGRASEQFSASGLVHRVNAQNSSAERSACQPPARSSAFAHRSRR